MNISLAVFLFVAVSVSSVFAASGDVVHIKDEKDFKENVLKFPGVAMVEFYAPWKLLNSNLYFSKLKNKSQIMRKTKCKKKNI